jgi:hypothetical protein
MKPDRRSLFGIPSAIHKGEGRLSGRNSPATFGLRVRMGMTASLGGRSPDNGDDGNAAVIPAGALRIAMTLAASPGGLAPET